MRFGWSTVAGVLLVIAATGRGVTWRPELPDRVLRGVRPGEGPRPQAVDASAPGALRWTWTGAPRSWMVVLVDGRFDELARVAPAPPDANSVDLSDEVLRRAAAAGPCHWFVETVDRGRKLRSRLAPLAAPPR